MKRGALAQAACIKTELKFANMHSICGSEFPALSRLLRVLRRRLALYDITVAVVPAGPCSPLARHTRCLGTGFASMNGCASFAAGFTLYRAREGL